MCQYLETSKSMNMNERERRFSASCDFEIEEVANKCSETDNPNYEAWNNLYSAMCTPEFFPDKRIRNGKYKSMLYPVSYAETEEMERRLLLAEEAQKVEDERFSSILKEMKSIAEWSKNRHFNCSGAALIAFIFVSLFISLVLPKGKTDDLQYTLSAVQSWSDKDTSLTPEQTYDIKSNYSDRFFSPTIYKYYYLNEIGEKIEENRRVIEYEKDEKKKAKAEKDLAENLKEFNRRNELSTQDIKKQVITYCESEIDKQNSITLHYKILYYLLLTLIPLYLISCYQFGFNISRFINFRESMQKLCKIGSGVAVLGAGTATVVDTIRYSDGSTEERRSNPGIVFVLMGLLIMVYCSSFALLIMTVNGLYYNYYIGKRKIKRLSLFDNDNVEKGSLRYYFNCIMNLIFTDYRKLFTFDGRENRLSYALFFCFNILFFMLLTFWGIRIEIIMLFFMMAFFSSMVRRLHDIGYSGKLIIIAFFLLGFVPYLGLILLGATALIPGTKGVNEYGDVPESFLD